MRQKLTQITLGVANLGKAEDSYEKGLVWKKSSVSTKNLVVFPLGRIVLALYPRKLLAEDAAVDAAGGGFSGVTFSYGTKNEAEVDEVLAEVGKLGQLLLSQRRKFSGVDTAGTSNTLMVT